MRNNFLICLLAMATVTRAGDHCPKKCDCDQMPMIILCNNKSLRTMPKRISGKAQQLFADDNQIPELPGRMLINGASLRKLSVARNRINGLKLDNFRNTPVLNHLDLSYNNISLVPANAFFGLTELRILNLDSNQISKLSSLAFKHLYSLRELLLSDNSIETLPEGLFTSLEQLHILRLDGNQISTIPRGIFRSMPELLRLNLGRNRIHHISIGVFGGLESLQNLHLHNNQIENLDVHLPVSNGSCDTKGVGNSSFSEIVRPPSGQRGAFENLRELRTLDLRNNRLVTVRPASFLSLRQLRTLDVGGNLWRCDCSLKRTIEALRSSSQEHNFIQARIICHEPRRVKGSNLMELGFHDLQQLNDSKSAENTQGGEAELTTSKMRYFGMDGEQSDINSDATTVRPSRDSTTIASFDNRSKSIRNESRPSNDPMTQYNAVSPSALSKDPKPTLRSLISTRQIGPIASTTSQLSNRRENKRGGGVDHHNPIIRNSIAEEPATGTLNNTQRDAGKLPSKNNSRNGIGDRPGDGEPEVTTRKKKKQSEAWLMPTAIALSIVAFFACASIVVQFMARGNKSRKCCVKGYKTKHKSSIRSITSNPLLYDSHHFVSRPLPQAPRQSQSTRVSTSTEEVHWTNNNAYGLENNRSNFASTQNHIGPEHEANFGRDSQTQSVMNEAERPRFRETPPNRGRNVYSYVETIVPTRMLDRQASFLSPSNYMLKSDDNKFRRTLELRKKMEERRRRRRMLQGPTKSAESNVAVTPTIRGNVAENKPPPPPPKRNESSKIRCRELMRRNNQVNIPEYCEIDSVRPKKRNPPDYSESLLYKKYIKNILASPSNMETTISKSVEKTGNNIHGLAGHKRLTRTVSEQQYSTRNAMCTVRMDDAHSSKYDRLIFGDRVPEMPNLSAENFPIDCSRSSLLLDDSFDQDSCFNSAEDDFVFAFPRVSMRRSYPGGLFGSDQHILDTLREQDLGIYKPRHHTAPTGVENLTVPLSEISTDEDDLSDVFKEDSRTRPSYSSAGSLSTVLANTPDSKDDVFVYTMARETPIEIIPKIIINDASEEGYETVGHDLKANHDKITDDFVSLDDTSHHYHHLQFMYSGTLADKKCSINDQKSILKVDTIPESSPPMPQRSWKNYQKQFKQKRRERHYYSIDPHESYDNIPEKSKSRTDAVQERQKPAIKCDKKDDLEMKNSVILDSRENKICSQGRQNHSKDFLNSKDSSKNTCNVAQFPHNDFNGQITPRSVEELLRQCCPQKDNEDSIKKRKRSQEYCSIKLDENKNPVVKMRLVKSYDAQPHQPAI